MKIAIIGTYEPRICGIATFTKDLFNSLNQIHKAEPKIIAMSNSTEEYFPSEVALVIRQHHLEDYKKAASFINSHYDICIIQHEYGIFGADDGMYILELAKALHIPFISNLHTILKEPSLNQKRIIIELAELSQQITVMTSVAINLLHSIYDVNPYKIKLIPHGVPSFQYDQQAAKEKLKLNDKRLALSFGFLGKNKGYETALEAVSKVEDPNFRYIILGRTHPNVVKEEGEIYRHNLEKMVIDLNISDKVIFINIFAEDDLLIDYLQASDIYISPYPHEGQISSGTLTFAIGAGAAVISTPYLYAKDLLANDRGVLFDFNDSDALSAIINDLLQDVDHLAYYRKRAKDYGETISWKNIGKSQYELLSKILNKKTLNLYFKSPLLYKPNNIA